MAVMIDLIFGDPNEGAPRVASHLHDVMCDLDPALYSQAQRQIFELARLRMLGVVRAALGSMGGWQESLKTLADELGGLERDVAKALARSLPEITEEDIAPLLAENAKA